MAAPFTIGFDASTALLPGGIPRYVRELLLALGRLEGDSRIVVLINSLRQRDAEFESAIAASPRMSLIRRRLPGPLLMEGWSRWRRPTFEYLTGERCDVVHGPAGYVPAAAAPIVVTAHDLCFLREEGGARAHFARVWPRLLPGVAGVIAPSAHVAAEVGERFQIESKRVRAIHSGINGSVFHCRARLSPEERSRLLLPERFLLALTDASPRKRPELLQATCDLLGESVPVVIAGLAMGAATKAGAGRVVLPRVSDATLAGLYAESRGVLLTTREEGFGFPLLEALACGTRVACGRHSSLAEIGGDLPDYVGEESAAGFAEAAKRLFESDSDPAWKSAAMAHASTFNWEASARAHMDFYRQVASLKIR